MKKTNLKKNTTNLVRGHQLAPGYLPVGRIVAVPSFGLPVGIHINGFFAEQFRHILMGGLFVAAQVQKFVAVTDNGFPFFFKELFELSQILYDN